MSDAARHARAVEQSLKWAEEAARRGDYEAALRWLVTVEAVEGGELPPGLRAKRRRWATAAAARSSDAAGRSA
jgi:hypothetical protein